jgi:hypothetical protein
MNTVRFAKIVEWCGRPDIHLLLTDPVKDKTLQSAIKSNRVMTVYQESGSTKTDYGTIGFEKGPSRQFLLFPKTLKAFAGQRVIGIKYDLLESIPIAKNDWAAQATPKAAVATPKRKASAKANGPSTERAKKAPPDKLVAFPKSESSEEEDSNEVAELKRRVREAMDVLEQGKQVAAFNLLKRIVEG